jgi:hypothetical protein
MTRQRTLPKSKRFYIVLMTLGWGISMSIFACAVFWKLGALSTMSALVLIFVAWSRDLALQQPDMNW